MSAPNLSNSGKNDQSKVKENILKLINALIVKEEEINSKRPSTINILNNKYKFQDVLCGHYFNNRPKITLTCILQDLPGRLHILCHIYIKNKGCFKIGDVTYNIPYSNTKTEILKFNILYENVINDGKISEEYLNKFDLVSKGLYDYKEADGYINDNKCVTTSEDIAKEKLEKAMNLSKLKQKIKELFDKIKDETNDNSTTKKFPNPGTERYFNINNILRPNSIHPNLHKITLNHIFNGEFILLCNIYVTDKNKCFQMGDVTYYPHVQKKKTNEIFAFNLLEVDIDDELMKKFPLQDNMLQDNMPKNSSNPSNSRQCTENNSPTTSDNTEERLDWIESSIYDIENRLDWIEYSTNVNEQKQSGRHIDPNGTASDYQGICTNLNNNPTGGSHSSKINPLDKYVKQYIKTGGRLNTDNQINRFVTELFRSKPKVAQLVVKHATMK